MITITGVFRRRRIVLETGAPIVQSRFPIEPGDFEFTFMFLAPWLYALHALLTGAAMVTMDLLQSRLGFGFSAGLFDYVLNFGKATHPLYLLPVGGAYFALYYFLFL